MTKRFIVAAIPLLAVLLLVLPVSAVCTATFTARQPSAAAFTVDFDSTVTCDGGQTWTYGWVFGDGVGVSALADPTYTYANPGKYTVVLTITPSVDPAFPVTHDVLVLDNTPLIVGAVGQTLFIGEEGLDVTAAMGGTTKIAWYSAGSSPIPGGDAPAKVITITPANFAVASGDFTGYTGAWYQYPDANSGVVAFYVQPPSLDLKIWNADTNKAINDGSVVRPQQMTFRIDSNLYPAQTERFAGAFLTIKVKDSTGAVLDTVTTNAGFDYKLVNLPFGGAAAPMGSQWFLTGAGNVPAWGSNYQVGGAFLYKAGSYEVWVESNLNKMKDNLGSVTGQTVSKHYTVTIKDDEVTITANTDTVVRGNAFSVTIQGRADQGKANCALAWIGDGSAADSGRRYAVWVKGGAVDSPFITEGQSGVCINDPDGAATVPAPDQVLDRWATVTTDGAGKRTIGFTTTKDTNDKSYTIRVEDRVTNKNDEIKVKVVKGAVTIDAEGTKSYYVGEEIKFFGEDTDSEIVYLFITGPNLPAAGGSLDDPFRAVSPVWNTPENVKSDDTWEHKWATGDIDTLDAGTYTIYAVSDNVDKNNLQDVEYDTVSVQLRKPFVNASLPSSRVAKGDDIKITGTAEGDPGEGVQIWVLGTNRADVSTEGVEDDKTFEKKLEGTEGWSSGQYFVVVQHPMYNDHLDVYPAVPAGACPLTACGRVEAPPGTIVWNDVKKVKEFDLAGAGRLMGSDAAQALVGVLDQPNVDDMATKLYFLLEEAWITVDAISDKYIGDKFDIKGTTNNAVDDTFLVTVTSASFVPTEKKATGEFSGFSDSTKVVKGTGIDNVWSIPLDTTGFKPDQYIVKVECIETGATTTTNFFVSEVPPTTAPPATTVPPVQTVPPITTAPPATTATPTTTPGFGAVIALIGLGAVAVLVLRRH